MTTDEAMAVFERHEVPHRFVDTGEAKELFPALKCAGDALAAEVRRLRRNEEADDSYQDALITQIEGLRADLAASRAEAARLRERIQKAAERCTCEAFDDAALEGKP